MKLRALFENFTSAASAFSLSTTEMPYYDNMLRNPEYFRDEKGVSFRISKNQSPAKYIEQCANARNTTREQLLANREQALIDKYAAAMQAGEKFPLPVIDYTRGFTQEGLHRAFAAEQINLSTMPYMSVSKT